MNEELIAILMRDRGISREEAISTINSQNAIEDSFIRDYLGEAAFGYRAPLDGSTMAEDKQGANALFKNKYGDINFFAQNWNTLKANMEQDIAQNPYYTNAEGNQILRVPNPNNLTTMGTVSKRESAKQAREFNNRIRQEGLPYQKVKRNAFYNPQGQGLAKFAGGGVYNPGIPNLFGTGLTFDPSLYQGYNIDPNILQNIVEQNRLMGNNGHLPAQTVNNSLLTPSNPLTSPIDVDLTQQQVDNQSITNPNGGINWEGLSKNQGITNPYDASVNENYMTPNNSQMGYETPTDINNGKEVVIGEPTISEESINTVNEVNPNTFELFSQLGNWNPYGTDIEQELYSLGTAIGNAKSGNGSTFNTISGIAAGGAALLGGARTALSGMSNAQARDRYLRWMKDKRSRQQYSPNSQTVNTQADAVGGTT